MSFSRDGQNYTVVLPENPFGAGLKSETVDAGQQANADEISKEQRLVKSCEKLKLRAQNDRFSTYQINADEVNMLMKIGAAEKLYGVGWTGYVLEQEREGKGFINE